MDREEKYRLGSLANFTPEQINQARANYERSAQRYPERHAVIDDLIKAKGLGNHREVVGHYAKTFWPMSEHEVGTISMYSDTTYAGGYGKGRQVEDEQGNRLTGTASLYPSANRPSAPNEPGGSSLIGKAMGGPQ